MVVHKINSIKEIIENYQFFIIDIWGVLHDGDSKAFPYAIEALQYLKKCKKVSMILSNSPRNQTDVSKKLFDKGIIEDFYDFLYTSGQEVENLLFERDYDLFQKLGKRAFSLGYSNLHEKAGHKTVTSLNEADYLLATRVPGDELEQSIPLLNEAILKRIPLICANPDLIAHTFSGPCLCPGIIYEYYFNNGGTAIAIGKPNGEVYSRVLNKLKSNYPDFNLAKTVVIGDGIFTDILGANRNDLDSVLISSGIHEELFDLSLIKNEISEKKFFELSQQNSISPNYICEKFSC